MTLTICQTIHERFDFHVKIALLLSLLFYRHKVYKANKVFETMMGAFSDSSDVTAVEMVMGCVCGFICIRSVITWYLCQCNVHSQTFITYSFKHFTFPMVGLILLQLKHASNRVSCDTQARGCTKMSLGFT